jgi:hypothetical protein
MTCGIYKLKFNGTHKVYIGQSNNIEGRLRSHKNFMKSSKCSKKLKEAYLQYGMPSIEVIIECEEHELDLCENEAIIIWNSVVEGFNTLQKAEDAPKYLAKGEEHVSSIYSNKQIEEAFLLMVRSKLTLKQVSETTGIEYHTLRSIRSQHNHKWLKEKYPTEYVDMINSKGSRNISNGIGYGNSKYSREDLASALFLLAEGKLSRKQIAAEINISYKAVSNIVSNAYPWLGDAYPEEYKKVVDRKNKYTMQ